ncbi:putative endopeptidase p60 precursor [Microbulbifer aggregans]|uniref:Putative endopeptidase p60 n=1 Tax=Microbulbifer aggregans TaxID=1769779 RepID=A0A1C9WAN2_9GAMM|nr:NlpC/P60 family protein [Microbulbifer aggregans]AOS98215.1 putative endopeptidase p60 precursor [Microbulbifer aggregans]
MRITMTLAGLLLALSLPAVSGGVEVGSPGGESTFISDVPKVREEMLSAEFWLSRLEDDSVRLTAEKIRQFNAANLSRDEHLHQLKAFPASLPRAGVLALIDGVSRPASSPRYHGDGRQVSDADYEAWQAAVQRHELPEAVAVQWGMVVQRASMRSYPTHTRIYKHPDDTDLDRLQETGVFPGQQLALLHESADGKWWFAVNYHYAAWLPKSAVAVGDRAEIEGWQGADARLMVTGSQVKTNYNPVDPRTSEVVLDMGVSLPLMTAGEVGHSVNGQNPYASYVVKLPVRDAKGRLEFTPALIARSQDVHTGPLEYRPSQVIEQAFKFLGERYGWGHDYNGRDCTGFVGEVYKSFGILMPRNSGQQGRSDFAPTRRLGDASREAKLQALEELKVGDLIYIPGHVMMYIGHVDGEPFVIHDVTGLSYFNSEGDFYSGTLSGVSVTPLKPLWLGRSMDFVDSIYAIKTII